jgi:hypothetical protein
MMSGHRWLALVAIAISAAACGGGGDEEGDTLTEQQATQAFTSMEGALAELGTELEGAGSTGSVDVTVSCVAGGSVTADGSWTSGQSFSLDLEFAACSSQDVTINGSLSYTGTATSGGGRVDMDGRLTFSGAVNGTCRVDVTMSFTQTSFQISGSMCGVEVNTTIQD